VYERGKGEAFALLGDEDGLLIVVKQGRICFPDTGKAGPGDISEPAQIAAIAPSGRFLTNGTRYVGGSCSHHKGEASCISKDGPQIDGFWRLQKELSKHSIVF